MPGPDGALSWFMAALCFIVTFLYMCIFRTASLLYTSSMTTFQVSRGEASLPICIFGGFVNLSGLVSGPMIHSFGVRSVAIFGGLMMSIGCIVSLFATGITFLVFSLGLISGTGQGILFSCTIVCINEYFDKRRGFALGLNLAGATMASFVFPKILEFVLLEYGLKGTLLLLGGMLLNIPAISLLFRPPPWIKNENKTVVEVTDASKDPYDALGKMSIVCSMNADQDKLYLEIEPSNAGRRGTVITIGDHEAVRRGTAISFGERPHRIRRETDTSHTEHGSLHSR
ncbi:monocarboxylate transporter, putative, partial [Ixodes scapularis]